MPCSGFARPDFNCSNIALMSPVPHGHAGDHGRHGADRQQTGPQKVPSSPRKISNPRHCSATIRGLSSSRLARLSSRLRIAGADRVKRSCFSAPGRPLREDSMLAHRRQQARARAALPAACAIAGTSSTQRTSGVRRTTWRMFPSRCPAPAPGRSGAFSSGLVSNAMISARDRNTATTATGRPGTPACGRGRLRAVSSRQEGGGARPACVTSTRVAGTIGRCRAQRADIDPGVDAIPSLISTALAANAREQRQPPRRGRILRRSRGIGVHVECGRRVRADGARRAAQAGLHGGIEVRRPGAERDPDPAQDPRRAADGVRGRRRPLPQAPGAQAGVAGVIRLTGGGGAGASVTAPCRTGAVAGLLGGGGTATCALGRARCGWRCTCVAEGFAASGALGFNRSSAP